MTPFFQRGGRSGLSSFVFWRRVLLYEDDRGKTCLEYDKPSSLFGQFGNDRITPTATMLDRKLEALVSTSFE